MTDTAAAAVPVTDDVIDLVDAGTAAGTGQDAATRAFSKSVMVSAVRCSLTYVLLPWVLPALGATGVVGPTLGVIISPVAVYFNVASIRRFLASEHPWRWRIIPFNLAMIVLLAVLFVTDVVELLG